MTNPHIDLLNRRLGDALGYRGNRPRFAWLYAPEQFWIVYDRDDRNIIRKTWADAAAPGGGTIGRCWVLGEWAENKAFDHHGFGTACERCNGEGRNHWGMRCESCAGQGRVAGVRIAVSHEWGYSPRFETACLEMPSEKLNANYISVIRGMLDRAAENVGEESLQEYLAEERYTSEKNAERERDWQRERSATEYDKWTGAFSNLEPGKRDGYMSFMRPETGNSGEGFFES